MGPGIPCPHRHEDDDRPSPSFLSVQEHKPCSGCGGRFYLHPDETWQVRDGWWDTQLPVPPQRDGTSLLPPRPASEGVSPYKGCNNLAKRTIINL